MQRTKVVLAANTSVLPDIGDIVVSARSLFQGQAEIVVGYPGHPNAEFELRTGDAGLYQAPAGDTYEVRAMSLAVNRAELLLTRLGPEPKLAAAFTSSDPLNSPFTEEELLKIDASVEAVKSDIAQGGEFTPHQLEAIHRRLDEIKEGARRMGRKDWIQYFAGSITSLCVSAAFAPEATQRLFSSIGSAFSWTFQAAPTLLLLT
ncbi:hypothetical protein [Lysobacter sp. TY2-98]|uniref:hypothetical protein n=1 Tax=Lysobacter sp. TY2-98 TaxID=2290922 RepID=UPI0013B41772|nr:hypothetical protein [Lysobacter sp. TY2-98]